MHRRFSEKWLNETLQEVAFRSESFLAVMAPIKVLNGTTDNRRNACCEVLRSYRHVCCQQLSLPECRPIG